MYSPAISSGLSIITGITTLFAVAALVGAIVVFVKLGGDQKTKLTKKAWSWRAFFSFDVMLVSGIVRFLYILSAFEIVAFSLGGCLVTIIAGGIAGAMVGLVGFVLTVAIGELICRVVFEFIMLAVKLTENATAIRKAIAPETPITSASGAAASAVQPSVGSGGSVSSASSDGEWRCSRCGWGNARGAFCANCGSPRS